MTNLSVCWLNVGDQNHTFHFPVGEYMVMLEDVALQLRSVLMVDLLLSLHLSAEKRLKIYVKGLLVLGLRRVTFRNPSSD